MSSPFNEAKYKALLEGLEITEIFKSDMERTQRIDSDFYSKKNLEILSQIDKKFPKALTEFVKVSDGNHMSISEYFSDEGIPYYRGGDIYNFFIEQTSQPLRIPVAVSDWPHMKRSHLQKGDVLLSIVGAIIGNLALVKTNQKATCSCKLAILRTKSAKPELISTFLKSYFGQNQIQKFRRGSGQTGLILEDFDQLLMPSFSEMFSNKIEDIVNAAFLQSQESDQTYASAEILLLETIGLKNFVPSIDPVNVKSFKESFLSTGRLDAEYYQKKYEEIEQQLRKNGVMQLKDVFKLLSNPSPSNYLETGTKVIKTKNIRIPSVEIENITDHTNEDCLLVEKNDLLFASMGVGSLGRVSYIERDIENCTIDGTIKIFRCRKEYQNRNLEVPTLLFLTSSFGQELIYKHVIGSTGIISISKENIENLIIPIFDKSNAETLTSMVLESQNLKKQSEQLLETAKRAVEIAIEQDEDAAIEYINALNLTMS